MSTTCGGQFRSRLSLLKNRGGRAAGGPATPVPATTVSARVGPAPAEGTALGGSENEAQNWGGSGIAADAGSKDALPFIDLTRPGHKGVDGGVQSAAPPASNHESASSAGRGQEASTSNPAPKPLLKHSGAAPHLRPDAGAASGAPSLPGLPKLARALPFKPPQRTNPFHEIRVASKSGFENEKVAAQAVAAASTLAIAPMARPEPRPAPERPVVQKLGRSAPGAGARDERPMAREERSEPSARRAGEASAGRAEHFRPVLRERPREDKPSVHAASVAGRHFFDAPAPAAPASKPTLFWQAPEEDAGQQPARPSNPAHASHRGPSRAAFPAVGPEWWRRLPDFVPVQALALGTDPRNHTPVYIHYRQQFQSAPEAPGQARSAASSKKTAKKGRVPPPGGVREPREPKARGSQAPRRGGKAGGVRKAKGGARAGKRARKSH